MLYFYQQYSPDDVILHFVHSAGVSFQRNMDLINTNQEQQSKIPALAYQTKIFT